MFLVFEAIVANFLEAVFAANVGSTLDPLAVCKVGYSHGSTSHSDGILGEAGDGHPGCHVISIDRNLGLVANSVKESVETEVIHTIVTANDSVVDVFLPKGMHVILIELFRRNESVLIGSALEHSVNKNTAAVLAPCTLCALKNTASGVGSRNCGVVGENDGLAVSTLDAGGNNIAHSELEVSVFKILALVVLDPLIYRSALGGHRGEHKHSVTAVNVETFSDRAKLVSGIHLSVSVHIVVETVVTVYVTESNLVTKIVVVSTLAVKDLAEESLLYHIKNEHLILSVAAVFEHHYRNTGALVCLYKIPALIEVVSAPDLGSYVFACIHAVDADLNVSIPRGGNYNTIYLGLVYNISVIGIAVDRLVSADLLAEVDAHLNSVLIKVADTDNVNVFDVLEAGL